MVHGNLHFCVRPTIGDGMARDEADRDGDTGIGSV